MVRKGFKMKLYPDMAEEYEKRHNELWPEMKEMIHEYGGRNYTIFLDRETNVLYIMETNPDNSPVCTDLHEVFHLD